MDEIALGVPQMHAVPFAVLPVAAGTAHILPHPAAVPVGLETVVPDLHEIVFVNIALDVVGADAGAGGNRAVGKDRTDGDAGVAFEKIVADVALIIAEEAFAGKGSFDPAFFACGLDEIHQAAEFAAGKLQFGVIGSTTHREDGKQPPGFETEAD